MHLPTLLDTARDRVPECVSACFVDLKRGEILASRSEPGLQSAVELAAIAGPELLSQEQSWLIDEWHHGHERRSVFEELVIVADDALHVWLRASRESVRALLLMCAPQGNLGMILVRARTLLPLLAEVTQ